jgi:hypothetical protein
MFKSYLRDVNPVFSVMALVMVKPDASNVLVLGLLHKRVGNFLPNDCLLFSFVFENFVPPTRIV